MNVSEYLEKMQSIQNNFLDFIENQDNVEENYQNLLSVLNLKKIQEDQHEFKLFLYFIAKVSNNHHRVSDFFEKIEKILLNFKHFIQKYFTNSEIFDIFKGNKRILLFLIHEHIITIDEKIFKIMIEEKYQERKYLQYFSKEIKTFLEQNNKSDIYYNKYHKINNENFLKEISEDLPENFEEERKNGENNEIICKFIQKDLINEFTEYINKTQCSLNLTINQSIFETNQFLLKKSNQISLIEYAAFHGSINIFNYLLSQNVELTQSLWIFAVHGNNSEIINILEKNQIVPEDKTYKSCYLESIKCFHKDIAIFMKSKVLQNTNGQLLDTSDQCLKYYNFLFIQNDDINKSSFCSLCKYDYYNLVYLSSITMKININAKKINKTILIWFIIKLFF